MESRKGRRHARLPEGLLVPRTIVPGARGESQAGGALRGLLPPQSRPGAIWERNPKPGGTAERRAWPQSRRLLTPRAPLRRPALGLPRRQDSGHSTPHAGRPRPRPRPASASRPPRRWNGQRLTGASSEISSATSRETAGRSAPETRALGRRHPRSLTALGMVPSPATRKAKCAADPGGGLRNRASQTLPGGPSRNQCSPGRCAERRGKRSGRRAWLAKPWQTHPGRSLLFPIEKTCSRHGDRLVEEASRKRARRPRAARLLTSCLPPQTHAGRQDHAAAPPRGTGMAEGGRRGPAAGESQQAPTVASSTGPKPGSGKPSQPPAVSSMSVSKHSPSPFSRLTRVVRVRGAAEARQAPPSPRCGFCNPRLPIVRLFNALSAPHHRCGQF